MKPPSTRDMLCFNCLECQYKTYDPKDVFYGYCPSCYLCMADSTTNKSPASYPPIWVIHDHPLDYPEHFVVRVAWGPWQEKRLQLAATLELARLACQMEGASFCLKRYAGDDPRIAECWI